MATDPNERMSYTYDEPEAAAIDLMTHKDEVHYGMVKAEWEADGGGTIVFFDTDSGHPIGEKIENKEQEEMAEELVEKLVKHDEEIRSQL